jgi:DNA-binding NtrC family response regulator
MLSRARALVGLALPGQTLLDRGVFDLARDSARGDHPLKDPSIRWLEHGAYTLDVLDGAWKVEVAEIGLVDEAPLGPPPRVAGQGAKDGKKARPDYRSPDEVSEEEILEALRAHAFKIQPTAAALGISRTSLYTLIDCSGRIRKARDLDREQIEAAAERHDHDLDAMAADLEVSRKGLSRRMTQLGMKR